MEVLVIFLFKIFDNALATAKTIYVSKGKYFAGALFNALAFLFYTLAFSKALKADNMETTLAMAVAVFLGTYFTGTLFRKSEKAKLYIFDITSDTFESGIEFADTIRDNNIAIKTYKTYDTINVKTLSCKVYCTTKEESRIVEELIDSNFKYHKYLPIED